MHNKFRWWALAGISMLAFTAFLDFTIVNTALPFIQRALNTTVLQLQWVTNSFSMVLSMTMIAAGKFGDMLGRKKVFFIGVAFFTVAALGAGLSSTIEMLIAFRALQGLGASVLFISSTALLTDIFPPKEHARAVGLYSVVTGTGLTIGPAFGGLLVGLLDWRWVFWINIPLILLGLAFCSFSLKTFQRKAPLEKIRFDWLGFVLLMLGLGGVMYGIISGANEGWLSLQTLLPSLVGIFSLIALVIIEEKIKVPLLEIKIFKNKMILLATLSAAAAGIVSYVFMFFDPLYLKVVRQLSPYMIGILVAIIPVAQILVSSCFSHLLQWWGAANLTLISIGSAFISAFLHHWIGADYPLAALSIPFFLLGITWGLTNTSLVTIVNQSMPEEKAGKAIGTIATFWNVAGGIFLAIASVIFNMSEKIAFDAQVEASSVSLTAEQTNSIHALLEDSSDSLSALKEIVGGQAEAVLAFFQQAFLSAFHLVVETNALFLLIFFLLAFRLRLKLVKEKRV